MKNKPFMKAVLLVICIFSMSAKSSVPKSKDELREYRAIVKENSLYQSFSFADGYPSATFMHQDGKGYHWFRSVVSSFSNKPTYRYYRFDGLAFDDVFLNDKYAKNDTIVGCQPMGRHLYMRGQHCVYRWEGDSCTRFKFPEHDKTLIFSVTQQKVSCFGYQGWAELIGDDWKYYPYKKQIKQTNYHEYDFIPKHSLLLRYPSGIKIFSEIDTVTVIDRGISNDYVIKHPGPKKNFPHLQFKTDKNKKIWMDFGYKNWISCLDANSKTISYHELPQGYNLSDLYNTNSLISDDKGDVWVFCSTPKGISGLNLSTHIAGDRHYEEVKYQIGKDVLMELMIIAPDDNCSYTWRFNPEKSYYPEFSNLLLGFDTVKGLHRLPIEGKDNMTYRVIDNKVLGIKRHDSFPDVHEVTWYNPLTGSQTEANLISKSNIYQVGFSNDHAVVQLNDRIVFIPLNRDIKLTNLYGFQQNGDQTIEDVFSPNTFSNILPENIILVVAKDSESRSHLLHYKSGVITPLSVPKTIQVSGFNKQTNDIYYSSLPGTGWEYSKINLDTQKITPLISSDTPLIFAPTKTPFLYSSLLRYSLDTNKIVGKPILGWKRLFGQYPDLNEPFAKVLFYWFTKMNTIFDLGDSKYFFRTNQTSSSISGVAFTDVDHTSAKFVIEKDGDFLDVRMPSLIYDAQADTVMVKPTWLRCLQNGEGRTFIAHQKKSKERSYLQVSEYIKGRLMEKPSDLKIYGNGKSMPNIDDFRKISNNMLSIHCADTLFYYQDEGWKSISLEPYKRYGSFNNSVMYKDHLYLCFQQMLIKYVDNVHHYLYGVKDGLPDQLWGVLCPDANTLLIIASEGLLRFDEQLRSVRLDLNSALAISDTKEMKLNNGSCVQHRYSRIRFVLSMLGSLIPGDGYLVYRLKGLSEVWNRIPFLRDVQYDKLNPGSYRFEAYAIDRYGNQTAPISLDFEILSPWYLSWWAYLIYIMGFIGMAGLIFKWRIRSLKAKNAALEDKVEQRTRDLKEQQRKVKESIDYASLIQRSVLPQHDDLCRVWKDHFIVWKPRDIVGGDLYWLHELKDGSGFLFALLDCTGHGVPGALLTMTVNSALNYIVREREITTPHQILEELHLEIGFTLHQNSVDGMQDGLDIALFRVKKETGDLCFAGAKLQLVIYDSTQPSLYILKGGRYSLGGSKYQEKLQFEDQHLNLSPDSILYLFTDGIVDQPASASKTTRLGSKKLLEIISGIASQPLQEQQKVVEQLVANMLEYGEQRDDITVIGLKM